MNTRVWSAAAAGAILLCLAAIGVHRAPAASGTPDSPSTVAEVSALYTLPSGEILSIQALIDPEKTTPERTLGELSGGLVPIRDGEVSAQYALWRKWAPAGMPVRVQYNSDWDPLFTSGRPVMQWALNQWNSVPGQSFRFADAGLTTAYASSSLCSFQISDGVNSVRFSYILPYGTLGSTCAVSDGTRVDGTLRIREFDLQVDGTADWSTAATTPASAYDLRSTMLHELGHALGLSHTDVNGAVMLPAIGRGQQLRTITQDDMLGVQALYGSGTTAYALVSPRFCRTSEKCTAGGEALVAGQNVLLAFGIMPAPGATVRGEAFWNGTSTGTVQWEPPFSEGGVFYLRSPGLGAPPGTGTFEFRVSVNGVLAGSFSAQVAAATAGTATPSPTVTPHASPSPSPSPTSAGTATSFKVVAPGLARSQ